MRMLHLNGDSCFEVANESATAALGVFLKPAGDAGPLVFDRNYLMLLPGERVEVCCLNRAADLAEMAWEGINVLS